MVVIGSVDFEGREEIYIHLKEKVEYNEEMYNNLIFDEDEHTVWIIWDKKE